MEQLVAWRSPISGVSRSVVATGRPARLEAPRDVSGAIIRLRYIEWLRFKFLECDRQPFAHLDP
jgi:hypothetical protein